MDLRFLYLFLVVSKYNLAFMVKQLYDQLIYQIGVPQGGYLGPFGNESNDLKPPRQTFADLSNLCT